VGTLDLDQVVNRLVQKDHSSPRPLPGSKRRLGQSEEGATSVLELVSEAAASIRQREQQATNAVARAHNAAKAVKQQLQSAEARAERAEAVLRQAENELAELTARVAQAHKDIELLQSYIGAKEAELAATENRAVNAEQRGTDSEGSIQRIVEAIRREFSVSGG
jgi:chromosome segregation ATPase